MTGKHYGFDDKQWARYSRPAGGGRQYEMMQEFGNDIERKNLALEQWGAEYEFHTDKERRRHLIRMLGHQDRKNVRRAMKELAKITGRKEGFPESVFDPEADTTQEANDVYRFVDEKGCEPVIADWMRWLEKQND